MAGVGIDAVIMQDTNPDLKKTVGSAAYFVSAAKNANHPALHATIRVDDQPVLRRRASVIVIGNVGLLPSGILLIPDAKPDDGLLDVLVASPADRPRLGPAVHRSGRDPAGAQRRPARPADRAAGGDHRRASRPVPAGRRHRRRVRHPGGRDRARCPDRPGAADPASQRDHRRDRRTVEETEAPEPTSRSSTLSCRPSVPLSGAGSGRRAADARPERPEWRGEPSSGVAGRPRARRDRPAPAGRCSARRRSGRPGTRPAGPAPPRSGPRPGRRRRPRRGRTAPARRW